MLCVEVCECFLSMVDIFHFRFSILCAHLGGTTKIFRIIRPTRIHVNKASFLMLNKWKNDTNKEKNTEERKNERKGVGITWAVFQQRQTQIKFIVKTTCFVPFEIILCYVAIDASVVLFSCCSSSCYYYYHCRIWCK